MNLNNYVDPNYRGPTLIRGYLKKLKCEKAMARFLKKFNKRYFVLDLNNYSFYYQEKEVAPKSQRFILTELTRIDPNPKITEVCDWKFAFMVFIGKRALTLHADSVSAHNEWCNGLRACIRPPEKIINRPEVEPRTAELAPSGFEEKLEIQSEKLNLESEKVILKNEEKNEVPILRNGHKAQNDYGVKAEEQHKFMPVIVEKNRNLREVNRKIDDEDEVKVLSGPRNIQKKDDFDQVIPVIFTRERPLPKRDFTPVINREETKKILAEDTKPIYQGRATSTYKERIVFNPGGISNMMNELDNLGLDKVEVRSGLELRQKISETKQMKTDGIKELQSASKGNEPRSLGNFGMDANEKKSSTAMNENRLQGYFTTKPIESKLNAKVKVNENIDKGSFGYEPKENENKPKGYFGPESKDRKSNLGGLSYRPITSKIKFVEKPEVVPDEETVKVRNEKVTRNQPQSSRDYLNKEKKVYKEVFPISKPQGNDSDWDNWDD